MTEYAIRQLACATIIQAVRDYFHAEATETKRKAILKDLRSDWMDFFTNGTSAVVAEQIEKNPKEIAERLHKHMEENDEIHTDF